IVQSRYSLLTLCIRATTCSNRAGSARLRAGESAQVLGVDPQRHPRSRLLSQRLQDGVAGHPVHLDTRGGVQGLTVGALSPLPNHPHVELHGLRVRVDLDDCYLGAVLVDVLVECDQAGLIGRDEVTQLWNTPLFVLKCTLLEPVRGDEDEWPGHRFSFLLSSNKKCLRPLMQWTEALSRRHRTV